VRPPSTSSPKLSAYNQLRPSTLTAHNGADLVLLPSGPDTVHRSLLRETQSSTLILRNKQGERVALEWASPLLQRIAGTRSRYFPSLHESL